jgi:hypothetical protein
MGSVQRRRKEGPGGRHLLEGLLGVAAAHCTSALAHLQHAVARGQRRVLDIAARRLRLHRASAAAGQGDGICSGCGGTAAALGQRHRVTAGGASVLVRVLSVHFLRKKRPVKRQTRVSKQRWHSAGGLVYAGARWNRKQLFARRLLLRPTLCDARRVDY